VAVHLLSRRLCPSIYPSRLSPVQVGSAGGLSRLNALCRVLRRSPPGLLHPPWLSHYHTRLPDGVTRCWPSLQPRRDSCQSRKSGSATPTARKKSLMGDAPPGRCASQALQLRKVFCCVSVWCHMLPRCLALPMLLPPARRYKISCRATRSCLSRRSASDKNIDLANLRDGRLPARQSPLTHATGTGGESSVVRCCGLSRFRGADDGGRS
jgi:hypothetical protein